MADSRPKTYRENGDDLGMVSLKASSASHKLQELIFIHSDDLELFVISQEYVINIH